MLTVKMKLCYKTILMLILLSLSSFILHNGNGLTSAAMLDSPRKDDSVKPKYNVNITTCDHYDGNDCLKNSSDCDIVARKCDNSIEVDGGPSYCYALWHNDTEGVHLLKKGCWINELECHGNKMCIHHEGSMRSEVAGRKPAYFCCCDGNFCNRNYYYDPVPKEPVATRKPADVELISEFTQDQNTVRGLLFSLVPLGGMALVIGVSFYLWRRYKLTYRDNGPAMDPSPLLKRSTSISGIGSDSQTPLQLLEIKARGRFGAVWKAQLLTQFVAVKIFPLQDKDSWVAEQDIYSQPKMKHDNLLKFIAAEKRGENHSMELWLITEFHELGSVYDFLKGNLLSWADTIKLAETMASGLAYLHEDIPSPKIQDHKPAITHRDFKSRNVLVKKDMSACIADFGLAMKFDPCNGPGDTHGQVGTRRYMAPEVLEGAINFNRDAFLRIDMYACGLVLWEMLSRCTAPGGPVAEYQQPFEKEVGLHPTLEDMQDHVVNQRKRPTFKDYWHKHAGMESLIETIEECWDHDAEARLSAGCVEERIGQLRKFDPSLVSTLISSDELPDPLIIDPVDDVIIASQKQDSVI